MSRHAIGVWVFVTMSPNKDFVLCSRVASREFGVWSMVFLGYVGLGGLTFYLKNYTG
jgi:hypothetical protein